MIKIDVEGFEKSVLLGLRNTLVKHRPFVVMEFSESTRSSFANFRNLKLIIPEGYGIKRIKTNCPYCIFFNNAKYVFTEFDFKFTSGHLILEPLIPRS